MQAKAGNFFKISGLTSANGCTKNGKIGIARSIHADRGHVGVEILGVSGGNPEQYAPPVAIKESNLEAVPNADGYKLLDGYLINKMYDAKDKGIQLGALQERFAIPGFVPTWRDNATMVTMLRMNGRAGEAQPYSEKCIEEIPRDHPQRNTLLYDFAACLFQEDQLQKALDVTLQIDPSNQYNKQIKTEMLGNISERCGKTRDEIKEPALRELINLVPQERQGRMPWERGAAICPQQRFEDGVKYYEQAVDSGIDGTSLMDALALRRSQAASVSAGHSGLVMGSVPNGAGGQSPVFFKQV